MLSNQEYLLLVHEFNELIKSLNRFSTSIPEGYEIFKTEADSIKEMFELRKKGLEQMWKIDHN